MKEVWIIGCGGSEADGIGFTKVFGDKDRVKEVMFQQVKDAKDNAEKYDGNSWTDGTESIYDISETPQGTLYAYASFDTYHIDWEAIPAVDIEQV